MSATNSNASLKVDRHVEEGRGDVPAYIARAARSPTSSSAGRSTAWATCSASSACGASSGSCSSSTTRSSSRSRSSGRCGSGRCRSPSACARPRQLQALHRGLLRAGGRLRRERARDARGGARRARRPLPRQRRGRGGRRPGGGAGRSATTSSTPSPRIPTTWRSGSTRPVHRPAEGGGSPASQLRGRAARRSAGTSSR